MIAPSPNGEGAIFAHFLGSFSVPSAVFLVQKEVFLMYPNPYQFNPYQQPYQYQQPMQKTEVIKVNGHGGAEMLNMAPNCNALVLDTSAPIVWLIQTDGAGYKSLSPYDIIPHEEVAQSDYKSLEERIAKLEGIINGKSDTERYESER